MKREGLRLLWRFSFSFVLLAALLLVAVSAEAGAGQSASVGGLLKPGHVYRFRRDLRKTAGKSIDGKVEKSTGKKAMEKPTMEKPVNGIAGAASSSGRNFQCGGEFWKGGCGKTQVISQKTDEGEKRKVRRWGRYNDECVPVVEVVIEGKPEPVAREFWKQLDKLLVYATTDLEKADVLYVKLRNRVSSLKALSVSDAVRILSGFADANLALGRYDCAAKILARAYRISNMPVFLRRLVAVYDVMNDRVGYVAAGSELVRLYLSRGKVSEALRVARSIYDKYSNDRWAIAMLLHVLGNVDSGLTELLTRRIAELGKPERATTVVEEETVAIDEKEQTSREEYRRDAYKKHLTGGVRDDEGRRSLCPCCEERDEDYLTATDRAGRGRIYSGGDSRCPDRYYHACGCRSGCLR